MALHSDNCEAKLMSPPSADGQMRVVPVLTLALLLVISWAPQQAAATDTEAILMTDKGLYEANETLVATLYLFQDGTRWDPPQVPELTASYVLDMPLNMSREAEGVYTASVTLSSEDLSSTTSRVLIYVRAEFRDETDATHYASAMVTVRLADIEVVVDLSEYYPEVGEVVEATVTTRWNGDVADATNVTVKVSTNIFALDPLDLEVEPVGLGRYVASYTVPSEAAGNQLFFRVVAEFGGHDGTGAAEAVVPGLAAWYHRLALEEGNLSFEILAGEFDGRAAEGALIRFEWDGERTGQIDASGKAVFTVPVNESSSYSLEGNITYGGETKEFYIPVYVAPTFEVVPVLDSMKDLVRQPGERVATRYEFSFEGEVLRDAPIHYYARSSRGLADFGTVTTDGEGRALLELTIPDASVFLDFHYETGGIVYKRQSFYFVSQEEFRIEVDRLEVGSPTTVNLKTDPARFTFPFGAFLMVLPMDGASLSTDWIPISESGSPANMHFATLQSDGVKTHIFLPGILPRDQEYVLMAVVGLDINFIEFTGVVLRPGEGTASLPDGPGLWPLDFSQSVLGIPLYGWIVPAALAGVVAVLVRRRRVKGARRLPPPPPMEFAPSTGWPEQPPGEFEDEAEVAEEQEDIDSPRPLP